MEVTEEHLPGTITLTLLLTNIASYQLQLFEMVVDSSQSKVLMMSYMYQLIRDLDSFS